MEPEITLTKSQSDNSSSAVGTLCFIAPHTLDHTMAFLEPVTAIPAAAAALDATSSTDDMLALERLQGAGVFGDDEAGAREPAPPGEAGVRALFPPTADQARQMRARCSSRPPTAASASAAAFEGAAAAESAPPRKSTWVDPHGGHTRSPRPEGGGGGGT